LARRIRLYGKKRGDRRTGSTRLGSYGEAAFFIALLIVGGVGLYMLLARLILPEWWANRNFSEHRCTVLDKRLGEQPIEGTALYRPEILIEYQLEDGTTHRRWTYDVNHRHTYGMDDAQRIIDQFEQGSEYVCWYDPANPRTAVLVRGFSWWMWLLLILPASFVVIGIVGLSLALVHSGTSAERLAALAKRAAQLDLFDDGQERGLDFPNVPRNLHVTNSPGTQLAYRLPVDAAAGWALVGVILVTLLWNGIVAWFVIVNVAGHFSGEGDWLMTLLLAPFAGLGLGIIFLAGKQLMLTTGVGTTRIEVSAHPLYPGGAYEMYLFQTGPRNIASLEVLLVCDERASYRQGTDTRTETRRACEQPVYYRRKIEIEPGTAFEDRCVLAVPKGAMHSFLAGHNEVKWQLLVRAVIPHWPKYERQFPVVVYPPVPERRTT
jgi:hypothetical protein